MVPGRPGAMPISLDTSACPLGWRTNRDHLSPPRRLEGVEADTQRVEKEIVAMLQEMAG